MTIGKSTRDRLLAVGFDASPSAYGSMLDIVHYLLDRLEELNDVAGGKQLAILNMPKDSPARKFALLQQTVVNLEREVEQYKDKARGDIRSQLIFGNKQQATEVKFRQLKYQTQAMKRLGKQFGLALRYMAQSLDNEQPEAAADMKQLAHVLGEDFWTTEEFQGVKAPDLVKTTQAYITAKRISKGKDANP